MHKKRPNSLYRTNQRKKNILHSKQYFSDTFDKISNISNLSSRNFSSQIIKKDNKIHKHNSSTSSFYSSQLCLKKEKSNSNSNYNILNLIIHNNPTKFNYKKIKKKMKEMNNLYSNNKSKDSYFIPQSTNRVKEVYYNYNVLYGQNTKNLIRTYSPAMRPKSSSVNKFVKKMKTEQRETLPIFNENEVIELINAKCSDIGIDVKEHMISKFKDYCNAKCKNRIVDLTENYLGLNSVKFLGNILQNCDRISRLNLSKNNLGDRGAEILVKYIKNSYSIIALNISSNGITYKGGEEIFKNMIYQQSIIDFNISTIEGSNRNRLTFIGIKDILLYLKNNSFIEYLNLGGNSLKNEGFFLICKGLCENQSLNTLKIPQNEIEEKGIIQGLQLFTYSIRKLMNLDISKNKIGNEGLFTITDQLKFFPNLCSLNISYCGIEYEGFQYLIKNIHRKLEILNVSGNNLKSNFYDSLKPFFSFIGIRNLIMSKCHLGDKSTYELGFCMGQNYTIKKLNISYNEISDKGFKSFVWLFQKNLIIESFDCSGNFLTDAGVKELINYLLYNTCLKSINFYDNQLHNETGNLILEILERNKTLTFLNLYYNRIQMKIIDEINRILKINAEKQKLKIVPNLARSVRELVFNPKQFNSLTTKIKEKKIEQNNLYQKVKKDDKIYSSKMSKNQKKVNIKINDLNILKNQIKVLDDKINEIETEINLNQDKFILEEHKLNNRIYEEKNKLNSIMSEYTFAENDYDNVKQETSNVLSVTKEKHKLSIKTLKRVENSLVLIKNELISKNKEYQKLMSLTYISKNLNRRKSLIDGKKNSNTMNRKSSISRRKSAFFSFSPFLSNKKLKDEISNYNNKRIKKHKNISIDDDNKNKKMMKMRSDSKALMHFSEKKDSSADEESNE